MSDEEEVDSLDSYLSKFSNIKKTGKPCKIEDARTYFLTALKKEQEDASKVCYCLSQNLNQVINYYRLKDDELLLITDDLNYTATKINVYAELLRIFNDLYKHKEEYNAWVLEEPITLTINDKEVKAVTKMYYVEPKSVKKSENRMGSMYL